MAVTTDPATPVEGDTVALESDGSGGTFVRWELTSVPSDSAVETGFLIRDGEYLDEFEADVAGEYGVTAHGYVYRRDPRSHVALTQAVLVGSESETVHVSAVVDLPITTTLGHGATLRLGVLNDNVATAELVLPLTEISRLAILDTTVAAAVAALVDEDVADIADSLEDAANDLRREFTDHRSHAVSHPVNLDTTNAVNRAASHSTADSITLVNRLAVVVIAHAISGADATDPWHAASDTLNVPLAPLATTQNGAVVLLADLRERVFERHRVKIASPGVHAAADNTNALSTPSLLDTVIVEFLDAVADAAPVAAAGEPGGASFLAGALGFRRLLA